MGHYRMAIQEARVRAVIGSGMVAVGMSLGVLAQSPVFEAAVFRLNGSGDTGTSIQEQLGLKLEPGRAPLQTLVIEHIERPSEN